ncbi:MAG: DNA internalization-related competence protein ComEC/Rec2 [Deltaproteobacteria bacterium]|nr:DNA internalization-related competence protein ComEC/Rec2 [Deltaproteobacteria bacterium]
MRRPMFYPLIGLIIGILIGDNINTPPCLLIAGAGAVLFLLLISVRRRWDRASFVLLMLLMLIVGLFDIQRPHYLTENEQHIIHQAGQGRITVEGVVQSAEAVSPSGDILVVNCRRLIKNNSYISATGNIRLVVPGGLNFQYGDFVRFHCALKTIHRFHNPGSFDYKRHLNHRGIYVSGFVANRAGIVLIRRNSGSGIYWRLETFRLYLRNLIYMNAPSPQREIIEAMTLGNQKSIPPDVRDDFAKTGTSHILSISGLHVGMVAAGSFLLIFFLTKFSEYLMLRFNIVKIATAASLGPVIIYALVAGMGTTVMRSTLMTVAVLAALLIEKQRDLYNVLFAAALIILIIAPESLFDISFQLSFGAVFAILYIVPKFRDLPIGLPIYTPHWLQTLCRRVYLFLLVSAAATLGTLPIIVFYFNRASTVTLIANLVAVPLLGMLALIPAMGFIIVALFSPWMAGLLISAASCLVGVSVAIIHRLADLSWSTYTFTKPNMAEMIVFYVFLFLLVETWVPADKRNGKAFPARHPMLIRILLIISLILIIGDSAYLALKDKYASGLRITAIDVGQGSATLLQFPHGVKMLVDGGGFHDSSFDMGKAVIAPFLYAQRIKRIDIVALTHPHPDHLQGLIHIIKNFDVREVWCTHAVADDELYQTWAKLIRERALDIKVLSAQSPPEEISGIRVQFLWPLPPPIDRRNLISYHDVNDSSLVMKMTHGTNRFLLTGDISARVEALLLDSRHDLGSDLLFVPHHGSIHSNSIAFIHAASSRFAIISAGRSNVFSHPHPAVIERYKHAGTKIFRTDRNGAIFIYSDGKTLQVTPWMETPNQPAESQ